MPGISGGHVIAANIAELHIHFHQHPAVAVPPTSIQREAVAQVSLERETQTSAEAWACWEREVSKNASLTGAEDSFAARCPTASG